jgi:multidrug transporter EmrE-like cation transporter
MNRNTVYGLVTISALLATAMRLTRKYVMKHMKNYSIVFIDAILTGTAMMTTALYMGGFEQLTKDLSKLHGTTLLAFLAASLCITISTVIGYNLLRAEKLSYLIIVSTGVGVIATMFASALFLGEKITKTKLLSIPFLLTGVYLAQ